jgi:cytochrome c-type biogenesis protein CcmH/NrfG
MMNRYPRKPALIVLLATLALGTFYVTAWGRIERIWKKQSAGDQSLVALETRIETERKGNGVKIETWRAYGTALAEAKQYAKAANAFREVLALDPQQRDAKFQCGLALAQAGAADEFYTFQKDLVYSEAKLAVELFERPETLHYLSEDRFANLAKEAKNQAMD